MNLFTFYILSNHWAQFFAIIRRAAAFLGCSGEAGRSCGGTVTPVMIRLALEAVSEGSWSTRKGGSETSRLCVTQMILLSSTGAGMKGYLEDLLVPTDVWSSGHHGQQFVWIGRQGGGSPSLRKGNEGFGSKSRGLTPQSLLFEIFSGPL